MVKLDNERGSICISSEVFTWLAGDAATRCFGVKGMAGRAKESGLVQLLRRESMTKGVKVAETEHKEVVIDLHIAVEHGLNIMEAGRSIINAVRYQVETITGIPVAAVNVCVDTLKV